MTEIFPDPLTEFAQFAFGALLSIAPEKEGEPRSVNRSPTSAGTIQVAEPALLASLICEIIEKRFGGSQSAALKAANGGIKELRRRERKIFVEPISQPTLSRLMRGQQAIISSNTEIWLRVFMRFGNRLLLTRAIIGLGRLAAVQRKALESSIAGIKEQISRGVGRGRGSGVFGSEELEEQPVRVSQMSDAVWVSIAQANLEEAKKSPTAAAGRVLPLSVFGPGVLGDPALTPREILSRERKRRGTLYH